jgi:hypothetical protein
MKFEQAVNLFVGTIIFLGIIMALLGFNGVSIDKTINWLIPLGISFISSALIGELVEKYSGDFFKKITLTYNIFDYEFSITAFPILVFIIKFWLFK